MSEHNQKDELDSMIQSYLDGFEMKNKKRIPELEIRFGTGNSFQNKNVIKPTSKIDSDNVVKQLYNAGFTTDNKDGQHLLRITPDTTHINRNNESKKSKVRLEIVGIDLIHSYCQIGEDIVELLKLPQLATSHTPEDLIKFTLKSDAQVPNKTPPEYISAINFKDLGFNVSYQNEFNTNPMSDENNEFVSRWNELRKTFRYINRVKFTHPVYPINADISIVKSSKKSKDYKYISEFTMKDASIFENEEMYEIELEIDNARSRSYNKKDLLIALRKCIRIVLSGLQQSNYPIGYTEKSLILESYLRMIHGAQYNTGRRIETKDFIGPSSVTLQIDNIIPQTTQLSIPNIRSNYSVTDKADGLRTLLYIANNGRLYLIDMNMNVMFTGSNTEQDLFKNSILDGEFIKFDKYGKIINLFAAFDIYYLNKSYVGKFDFNVIEDESIIANEEFKPERKCRYEILKTFIDELKIKSVISTDELCNFNLRCKHFAFTSSKKTIFTASKEFQSNVCDEYEKDGLIFTPTNTGVGGLREELKSKVTWVESFKWKPPQFNTVDFLVKIKKNDKGYDAIQNIYVDGSNLQGISKPILQYKTLELMCGFTRNNDGYLNPMLELLNDVSSPTNENAWEYKPVNFYPTNPADSSACYCNIILNDDVLKTEDGEFFEENTIVEFRYDLDKVGLTDDKAWKWIPIRNRHDKTTELRNAIRDKLNGKPSRPNYGNSYKVANSNWTSIHNPITELMITTGENIQSYPTDNGVYYNKTNSVTNTRGLRDFHNLFVKRKLIVGVSSLIGKHQRTLIDYAVGKGGDLPKWIDAKLSFVFGVDVKKDNIHNQLDGAYSRYLNEKKRSSNKIFTPKALFAVGNSGLNIRNSLAFGDKSNIDAQISNAIFGVGNNDSTLWKSVSEQFSVANDGFDISSIQFALHYFFKDLNSVHQFIRNVSECTRLGGFFIGTCYDGKVIFDHLKKNNKRNIPGEGRIVITTKDKQKKILEITQKYNETDFNTDEPCLGYEIDVWQESINQTFSEYLVNFTYLEKILLNYGFNLVSQDVSRKMGLPSGSGLFSDLFASMSNTKDSNTNYGTALNMTREEKDISFMNRYFVFKKSRNIENVNLVQKQMNENYDIVTDIPVISPVIVNKINKLDSKIIINPADKKVIRKIRVKKTIEP